MAAKTEVRIFIMIARYNGVAEFGIKFDLFHCRPVFFQTLPKIAKNTFKNIKKDDFCLDWLRNKNSIIKFTVPGNIFNQVARYSGVP